MGGFYYLPFPYLCFDIGLDEDRVTKAFQELEDRGMAVYDKDAQVVLINKWFHYNPIENENQAKGLNKQLAEIPKSRHHHRTSFARAHGGRRFLLGSALCWHHAY